MLNLKTMSFLSVPKLNLLKRKTDSSVTYYLNNIVQASLKSSIFSSMDIELKYPTIQY